MKRKYALYPIIMSSVALFCFIVVVLVFAGAVQPPWGKMMLFVLPSLILGTVALLAATGKLGASATVAWTTILSVVLLLASVFCVFLLLFSTAMTTTTDIKYYSRAYEQVDELDAVKEIFPKTIPEDAEGVAFFYTPQILQGAEMFELSYTTTDEKITEWVTLLEKEATWIGEHSDGTAETQYQLYWDGGDNHGEKCYVLIDEDTRRITFYYSLW